MILANPRKLKPYMYQFVLVALDGLGISNYNPPSQHRAFSVVEDGGLAGSDEFNGLLE